MHEIYLILGYLSDVSDVLLLILFFCLRFYKHDPINLFLFDFALIKLIIAVVSILIIELKYWDFTLNVINQNVFIIFYFVIGSMIYKTILTNQKVIQFGTILFLAALSLNCLWFDFRSEFFNYTVSVLNLIFAVYGFIFLVSDNAFTVSKSNYNFFWMNLAFLTYNVCMFSVMFFDDLIIGENKIIVDILWNIVILSNILLNIFLAIYIFEKGSLLKKVRLTKIEQNGV
jgi:hypothetical protein